MKWLILGGLLIVATVATGGLDLPAIALAGALWYFFTKTK